MKVAKRTNWMENHSDDAALSELILGERRPAADIVGPIAGRLLQDFDDQRTPIALAVRLAVATTFAGAVMDEEGKTGSGKTLQFALETWEQMTQVPAHEPQVIRIDQAVIVLPFSAYVYAIGLHRHLGNDAKCTALKAGLMEAIITGKQGEFARTVKAWERLSESMLVSLGIGRPKRTDRREHQLHLSDPGASTPPRMGAQDPAPFRGGVHD